MNNKASVQTAVRAVCSPGLLFWDNNKRAISSRRPGRPPALLPCFKCHEEEWGSASIVGRPGTTAGFDHPHKYERRGEPFRGLGAQTDAHATRASVRAGRGTANHVARSRFHWNVLENTAGEAQLTQSGPAHTRPCPSSLFPT